MRPHNCHIHLPPNFSAFTTVEQAVEEAASQGLALLGASNYYDFRVYKRLAQLAEDRGVFALFGLEVVTMQFDLQARGIKVNDPGNPGKTYLCAKACRLLDDPPPKAQALLDEIRTGDEQRMRTMAELLNENLEGVDLDYDTIVAAVALQADVAPSTVVLQERHLAEAAYRDLARAGVAHEFGDDPLAGPLALRGALMKAGKPAYVEEPFVTFEQGVELARETGGVPCYPVLADGVDPVTGFEADPAALAEALLEHGIAAAEFIPNRNLTSVLEQYVPALREAGILVSAGTEHNTRGLIPLVPECKDGPVPDSCQAIFWEGACVLAAHQVGGGFGERDLNEMAAEGAKVLGG